MAIKVTYRRTSRLSMRIVKNGDVHVSAPIGMPREKVMAFIEEHKDWINKAKKKTYERQKQRAEFFNKLPLTTRAQADEALKRLKALVDPMMEKHAKEMGVKPSIVYYKPTISRYYLALGPVQRERPKHLHFGLRPTVAEMVCRTRRSS